MIGAIDALYRRILLAAHPVGSVYQSTVSTNPATLFGGTWVAIAGRFLLAAGDGYTAGNLGGQSEVALTSENNGPHTHPIAYSTDSSSVGAGYLTSGNSYTEKTTITKVDGRGVPHNNMPPYLVVYMWRRTA